MQHTAERMAVGVQARAAQSEGTPASALGAAEAPAGADPCCQLSLTPARALEARAAEQRPPASEARARRRAARWLREWTRCCWTRAPTSTHNKL